ncbi:MAG: hypothetical protein IJC53_08490 [Clostridia bacterium]|nr:hypothetical protein [Clostridia bacterium]
MKPLSRRTALLCGLGFAAVSAGLLILFTTLLLGEWHAQILTFIILFAVIGGLSAVYLARNYPLTLIGYCAGAFIGLFLLALAFEKDTLGSYGLIRLFVSLAVGLLLGSAAELVGRILARRAEKARREAYLARLLYKK